LNIVLNIVRNRKNKRWGPQAFEVSFSRKIADVTDKSLEEGKEEEEEEEEEEITLHL
jgi:hypothetical protein